MEKNAQKVTVHDDDEIDLRELVRTLIKHKKVIILVALLILLGSFVYALSATPVYKATAIFLPPNQSDISHFNIPEIYKPNQEKLYQRFAASLESRQVYWEAFKALNLLPLNEEAFNNAAIFDELISKISLQRPKITRNTGFTPNLFLTVRDKSPEIAANIANKVSELANDTLAKSIVNDINELIKSHKSRIEKDIKLLRKGIEKSKLDEITKIRESDQLKIREIKDQMAQLRVTAKKNRLNQIEQLKEEDELAEQEIKEQIAVLRAVASTKRKDRIKVLEEAAAIAKKAEIIGRSSPLSNSQLYQDKTAIYTEVSTQAQPLYLRGEKALRAEIEELKNRESDAPFMPELRELQQQLKLLEKNKKIATLQARTDDSPFIPQLAELEKQLILLENNRKIEILLSRKDNDPFIESLREKQLKLEELNSIILDPSLVKLANVDKAAFPPQYRESPNRKKIVSLGLVLGLALGILVAFLVNFWQSLYLKDETTVIAK